MDWYERKCISLYDYITVGLHANPESMQRLLRPTCVRVLYLKLDDSFYAFSLIEFTSTRFPYSTVSSAQLHFAETTNDAWGTAAPCREAAMQIEKRQLASAKDNCLAGPQAHALQVAYIPRQAGSK